MLCITFNEQKLSNQSFCRRTVTLGLIFKIRLQNLKVYSRNFQKRRCSCSKRPRDSLFVWILYCYKKYLLTLFFHKDTFKKIYLKFHIYRTHDINNLIFMRFILGILEYFRLVWCLSPFLSEPFPWKFWNISSFQASLSLKLVKLVHEVNQYVGFRVTTGLLPLPVGALLYKWG